MANATERRGWDGDRVLGLRERFGLTQDQLADRMGVNRESISRWENGWFIPGAMASRLLDRIEKDLRDEKRK